MEITIGPDATRVARAQAADADMGLREWMEALILRHENGQNGAQLFSEATAHRRTETLDAIDDILKEYGDGDVYLTEIKHRLRLLGGHISKTHVTKLLEEIGSSRKTDQLGSYYRADEVRRAIRDRSE